MSKPVHTMPDPVSFLPRTAAERGYSVQLSLFEEGSVNRLVCLPMGDLHGHTFARIVSGERPQAVVDVRRHPYFGLSSLGREAAFALFRLAATNYVHLPLDLRQPPDQKERWRLRRSAVEFLSAIVSGRVAFGSTFVILMHTAQEAKVFDSAVRTTHVPGEPMWIVERVGG